MQCTFARDLTSLPKLRYLTKLLATGCYKRQAHVPVRRISCSASAQQLTIVRPDDWHLHVRDGAGLKSVVPHSAKHFGRAVIMPNLVPPVTGSSQVASSSLPNHITPVTHSAGQLDVLQETSYTADVICTL